MRIISDCVFLFQPLNNIFLCHIPPPPRYTVWQSAMAFLIARFIFLSFLYIPELLKILRIMPSLHPRQKASIFANFKSALDCVPSPIPRHFRFPFNKSENTCPFLPFSAFSIIHAPTATNPTVEASLYSLFPFFLCYNNCKVYQFSVVLLINLQD